MRRCVFLDRDGVINVKPADGEYVRSWDEFHFIPETVNWIRLFNVLDLLVIVITNQRGVARGLIQHCELESIHAKMVDDLSQRGAHVDDVLYCPHEIDSCTCRKPQPGLILAAQAKWRIDLSRSLMIGDSPCDRELAATCGLRFVGVADGRIDDVVTVRS